MKLGGSDTSYVNSPPPGRRRLHPLLFVGGALIFIGVGSLLLPTETPTDRINTLQQPVFVTGIVIDNQPIERGIVGYLDSLCSVKVSFTPANARQADTARTEGYLVTPCKGYKNKPLYQRGQEIPIAYESTDLASIVGPVRPGQGGGGGAFGSAVVIIVGGVLVWFSNRKRARTTPQS